MKKIILVLILSVSVFVLLNCGGAENENEESTEALNGGTEEENGAEEVVNPYYTIRADGSVVYTMIAPQFDWGKRALNILVRDDNPYSDRDFTYLEENMGEVVNDAAYRRALEIEEMYNITINAVGRGNSAHIAAIRNSVQAGDDAFDITFSNPRAINTLSSQFIVHDLMDFPNINVNEPWWDQNIVDAASIAHRSFLLAGDIAAGYKDTVNVVLFNKQMITDLGFETPYSLIEKNEWIWDNVIEMSKFVWNLNPADEAPSPESIIGFTGFTGSLSQTLTSCGVLVCRKESDDIPYLTFYNEHMLNAWQMITDFLYDRTLFYNFQLPYAASRNGTVKFAGNETVFFKTEFYRVRELRDMETDFGIALLPKYNKEQPRYYHHINAAEAPMMAVPIGKDFEDQERLGAVISAMAILGKNYITPAYYDISLKVRDTRDEDSAAIIDILFDSVYYDIGRVFDLAGIASSFNTLHAAYNRDITSFYESLEAALERALEDLLD